MERKKDMFKINMKKFNIFTIISILFILAGVIHYIYWVARYGIWYDIGIYALTIVLVVPGIIGFVLSLMEDEEKK